MQLAFDQVSFTYDALLAREEKKRAKKAAKQRGAVSNANTEAAEAGACAPASIAGVAGPSGNGSPGGGGYGERAGYPRRQIHAAAAHECPA